MARLAGQPSGTGSPATVSTVTQPLGSEQRAPVRSPRPLHVLSVVHSAVFGGPHNQALHLHRELGGCNVRLTVVVLEEKGDAPERLRAAGVRVVQIPLVRPRASRSQQGLLSLLVEYPRQTRRLRQLIRKLDIDVVEVHGLLNFDGAVAGRLAGRGVVWQLIDTRPSMALRRVVTPLVVLLADVVMTAGQRVAAEYPGSRLRPRRLRVFVPPVAPVRIEQSEAIETRRRTRADLVVPDGSLLIASVGNLNPQKGHEALLDAVAACRGSDPHVELRIRGSIQAGHETYASSLQHRARARGLAPETIGVFEDGVTVSDLMTSADIFALTSKARSEGLPTVVLEAMARSLPIVCTNVGSIAEVVRDGQSGLLVPPDDPERLTGALQHLIDDPAARERLGLAGHQAADDLASPKNFARLQLEAYELAVGRHRHDRRGTRRAGTA